MPILSKEDERYGYEPGSFAFWRNLAVYFCVFSVLGHWMEIVYCSFMNVFGIVDADSLVWDDPMYPFLVYGVGVVVSTHDLSLARDVCSRACVLASRLVALGPIDEALAPSVLARAYGSGADEAIAALS